MPTLPPQLAARAVALPTQHARELIDFSSSFIHLLEGAFTAGRTFAEQFEAHPGRGQHVLPKFLEHESRFARAHLDAQLLRAAACYGVWRFANAQMPNHLPAHALHAKILLDQELAQAWLWAHNDMRVHLQNFVAYFGDDPATFDAQWNGIHAVVRTMRAAARSGLTPALPLPQEDACFGIDLFIGRPDGNILALQIKAQHRGLHLRTFSRNREFVDLDPAGVHACLHLLTGARAFVNKTKIEVTPTFVRCGSLSRSDERYFAHALACVRPATITRHTVAA